MKIKHVLSIAIMAFVVSLSSCAFFASPDDNSIVMEDTGEGSIRLSLAQPLEKKYEVRYFYNTEGRTATDEDTETVIQEDGVTAFAYIYEKYDIELNVRAEIYRKSSTSSSGKALKVITDSKKFNMDVCTVISRYTSTPFSIPKGKGVYGMASANQYGSQSFYCTLEDDSTVSYQFKVERTGFGASSYVAYRKPSNSGRGELTNGMEMELPAGTNLIVSVETQKHSLNGSNYVGYFILKTE